jgi:hypothetical protein
LRRAGADSTALCDATLAIATTTFIHRQSHVKRARLFGGAARGGELAERLYYGGAPVLRVLVLPYYAVLRGITVTLA